MQFLIVLTLACLALKAMADGNIEVNADSRELQGRSGSSNANGASNVCPSGSVVGPWVVEEQFTQCGGTPYFANWFRANTCLPKINATSGAVDMMMVWNWNTTDLSWYEVNFYANDTTCSGDVLFLPTQISTDCGSVWPNVAFWGSSCSPKGHGISSGVWPASMDVEMRTPDNANLYIEYSPNQVLSYFDNLFNTTFLNSMNTCVNKPSVQQSSMMKCNSDGFSVNYLTYRGKGCRGRPVSSKTFHSPNFRTYTVGRRQRVPTDFESRWFCF